MELVHKIEVTIGGWMKDMPHLPVNGQKWLAQNIWWIAAVGAVLTGIGILFSIAGLVTMISLLGAVNSTVYGYYAAADVTTATVINAVISLVFSVAQVILLAMAINPLKAMQKKGWTYLLMVWIISALATVLSAIMSFSVLGFIVGMIFGAIGLAVSSYLLFEMHGQFSHTTKAASKRTQKA